jgi:hypothetical protein
MNFTPPSWRDIQYRTYSHTTVLLLHHGGIYRTGHTPTPLCYFSIVEGYTEQDTLPHHCVTPPSWRDIQYRTHSHTTVLHLLHRGIYSTGHTPTPLCYSSIVEGYTVQDILPHHCVTPPSWRDIQNRTHSHTTVLLLHRGGIYSTGHTPTPLCYTSFIEGYIRIRICSTGHTPTPLCYASIIEGYTVQDILPHHCVTPPA